MRRVAFYAHHQGVGHLQHAANVARNPDIEMLLLTSHPVPAGAFGEAVEVQMLETDVVENHVQPLGSPFHYTPLGNKNVRTRAAQIHDALNVFEPDVVISDVSMEVAALSHLAGYPVIVRRMHGDRHDLAHQNGYALANRLLAWFPRELEQDDVSRDVAEKTTYAGMLRSFPTAPPPKSTNVVVVLTSLGGSGVSLTSLSNAALATPSWQWRVAGLTDDAADVPPNVKLLGVATNVAEELAGASVVVGSAGHNVIRDVASTQRPLILIPEPRPFDEQIRFAQAVSKVSDVTVVRDWTADWNKLLTAALTQNPVRLADALLVSEAEFHRACSSAIERALSE